MYSPIEIYPFLKQLCLSEYRSLRGQHIARLNLRLADKLKAQDLEPLREKPLNYVMAREQLFCEVALHYYEEQTAEIAKANLHSQNSFEILAMNTHLLDSIIDVAFEYALEDLGMLQKIQIQETRKEFAYKERILPEKQEKWETLHKYIQSMNPQDKEDEQMLEYYQGIHSSLEQEIAEHQTTIDRLRSHLELLEQAKLHRTRVLSCFVIFARGGYGRGELSFSSDRDLGYCINTPQLNAGELELLQQLVIRIEHFLTQSGVETAHQYFEVDEDLSRFAQPETLQTVAAIMESRTLVGSERLAQELKARFYEMLPYEPYVQTKLNEYRASQVPALNKMNLKEDLGGLRSLQIPLWIASTTFGIFPSQTAELIALLIQRGILSARQAFQLSQALEFFYDLRNFVGAVKTFYYDDEVQETGCYVHEIEKNVIDDNLEKLYLFKKKRFSGFDEFDRYRLRLANDVREISRLILRRLLERTVVRTFSSFQLMVHLRKKRIMEIHATKGLPQMPLELIFNQPVTVLDLFIYIAQSGYDLSLELKDEMASVIKSLTPESIQTQKYQITQKFTQLMLAPYAAKAMGIMFAIHEPSSGSPTSDTLIGRFIPECNQMRFLLRNLNYHQHPVCEHTLKALQRAQDELEYLKKHYPELYHYLKPQHILALKWGVLFHDVGKIYPKTKHQISGTSIATRALERLGYQDEELFNLVTLLIAHHMTVAALSKTSAYIDQALQNFFEIADRDIIRVILLFLVNISDYSSVSDITANDTKPLRNFFEETYRIFAEMRFSLETENPIDLINAYLDNKKRDLEAATRIDLLISHSLRNDLQSALFEPLAQINPREYEKLANIKDEVQTLWKYLKMGNLDAKGVDQYTDKLIKTIHQYVSNPTVLKLTEAFNPTFNWFFTAFPNRFLLSSTPSLLAQKLMEFTKYPERRAIVSIITTPRGTLTGMLVYVKDQPKILSRVAYALSHKNLNIEAGKMNRIELADGQICYCYYFQVASRIPTDLILPRELENAILEGTTPVLKTAPSPNFIYNTKLRLEFLDSDNKGYIIIQSGDQFVRSDQNYRRVKITVDDAPLVYFKMTEVFDWVGVTIQQSLITTTGHQVADYFYVTESDYQTLTHSNFEEILKIQFSQQTEI